MGLLLVLLEGTGRVNNYRAINRCLLINVRRPVHSLAKLRDKIDRPASRQEQRAPCGLSGTAVSSLPGVYRAPLSLSHNNDPLARLLLHLRMHRHEHRHGGGVKFYPY